MLFAALWYNNFLRTHQETEDLWKSFVAIKEVIVESLPDSSFVELITTQDPEHIKQLNEHQLRWENEFGSNPEERKYAIVKQTLAQTIQSYVQQLLKNPHTSHEKKQELLTLNKIFSSK